MLNTGLAPPSLEIVVPTAGSRYRADIDGLRAVAVLPVVFYHYRIWPFVGGYVGVDIFFVISGYLITSLIHQEISVGKFSIISFYERRVRRIFPALFLLLAIITPLSLVFLLPYHLARYGDSLLATASFASNFEFWRESGYFDIAAESKPLIHTWSLAVEEQFYLVFPWLLYLLRGRSQLFVLGTLCALSISSFVFGVWAVRFHPDLAFYLPTGRAWELLLGGVLALIRFSAPKDQISSNAVSLVGGGLIGFSILYFTRATPFPGLAAAVPCLGAACVIFGGELKLPLLSEVLSTTPFVFVGLISYSLYLWHWPLFVFANYYALAGLTGLDKLLLVLVSFGLATLSWRIVETPFRRRNGIIDATRLFRLGGYAMAAALFGGLAILGLQGLPWRYSPDIRALLAEAADDSLQPVQCRESAQSAASAMHLCKIGANLRLPPSIMVWGDSESTALLPAIESIAQNHRREVVVAEHDGCPPLLAVARSDVPGCVEFNDAALKLALESNIREVILVGRWALYSEGVNFGVEQGWRNILTDQLTGNYSADDNHAIFENGLERTVRKLREAGKRVIFVASNPEIGWPLPDTLVKIKLLHSRLSLAPSRKEYAMRQAFVFQTARSLQKGYGMQIVDPSAVLCATGTCVLTMKGRLLYKDDRHLNGHGAMQLVPLLDHVI